MTDKYLDGRLQKVAHGHSLSSQTLRIFSSTLPTSRVECAAWILIHALEYPFAALIQGLASALRHQLVEHSSHRFYTVHQLIQLRELSLAERSPARRSAGDLAETKEQMTDFTQGET
jgi:hypothetical protein